MSDKTAQTAIIPLDPHNPAEAPLPPTHVGTPETPAARQQSAKGLVKSMQRAWNQLADCEGTVRMRAVVADPNADAHKKAVAREWLRRYAG